MKVASRKGEVEVATDEQPGKSDVAKIPTLRPAFRKDGTVTAASSSSISDGAAATVLTSADEAARLGLKPLARIVGHTTWSQEPEWFTTAPVGAIRNLLDKVGWKVEDVDLFEVNEAFAVVAMAPIRELGIPHEKLNVNGGATAWPSDRRQRHAPGGDLLHALRARGGSAASPALHRWRRGHGGGRGAGLALHLVASG